MLKALALSIALHAAPIVAIGVALLRADGPEIGWLDWPGEPRPRLVEVLTPVLHAGDLLFHSRAADVLTSFGEDATALRTTSPREGECWRYRFGDGSYLTLQFEGSVVERSWHWQGARLPGECFGRVARSVRLSRPAYVIGFRSWECANGAFCALPL